MNIKLYPPKANRRRAYGIQIFINGVPVTTPVEAESGDLTRGKYLGENVAQNPELYECLQGLKTLGLVKDFKNINFVVP